MEDLFDLVFTALEEQYERAGIVFPGTKRIEVEWVVLPNKAGDGYSDPLPNIIVEVK